MFKETSYKDLLNLRLVSKEMRDSVDQYLTTREGMIAKRDGIKKQLLVSLENTRLIGVPFTTRWRDINIKLINNRIEYCKLYFGYVWEEMDAFCLTITLIKPFPVTYNMKIDKICDYTGENLDYLNGTITKFSKGKIFINGILKGGLIDPRGRKIPYEEFSQVLHGLRMI